MTDEQDDQRDDERLPDSTEQLDRGEAITALMVPVQPTTEQRLEAVAAHFDYPVTTVTEVALGCAVGTRITVELSDDVAAYLDAVCKRLHVSESVVVCLTMRKYFDNHPIDNQPQGESE